MKMLCFVNFDKRKYTWCKTFAVSNCPRCQIVRFYPWCQIVRGVKLSWCQIVRCQIVRGVKLSGVKLSWCQIVRQHGRCQIVRGVKLSWCQIVLGPSSEVFRKFIKSVTGSHPLQKGLNVPTEQGNANFFTILGWERTHVGGVGRANGIFEIAAKSRWYHSESNASWYMQQIYFSASSLKAGSGLFAMMLWFLETLVKTVSSQKMPKL